MDVQKCGKVAPCLGDHKNNAGCPHITCERPYITRACPHILRWCPAITCGGPQIIHGCTFHVCMGIQAYRMATHKLLVGVHAYNVDDQSQQSLGAHNCVWQSNFVGGYGCPRLCLTAHNNSRSPKYCLKRGSPAVVWTRNFVGGRGQKWAGEDAHLTWLTGRILWAYMGAHISRVCTPRKFAIYGLPCTSRGRVFACDGRL